MWKLNFRAEQAPACARLPEGHSHTACIDQAHCSMVEESPRGDLQEKTPSLSIHRRACHASATIPIVINTFKMMGKIHVRRARPVEYP